MQMVLTHFEKHFKKLFLMKRR